MLVEVPECPIFTFFSKVYGNAVLITEKNKKTEQSLKAQS